ncbi:hypothetical protein Tco_1125426 [Tanacetum coccineum]|uniref:Uncharacterized protein n=1 Tax=Tanacetum coccineum TaxID=301880 RepID=A0ABQ5J8X9_9ASTR
MKLGEANHGVNVNPPPALEPPILPTALRVKVVQDLDELQSISAYIDSRLDNIEQFLNGFINPPNEINMDDLGSDNESVYTPLVSPFLDSDDNSDDCKVLNELEEYRNAGKLCHRKVINNIDGDDLAFPCMIGFRKFVAYFDPFLPMNIITRKAYNTILVEGLKSTGRKLVDIVRDVYVFVGSFTYVTDFVVLKDIGEFIVNNLVDVVMGRPFRAVTQLEYDCAMGLISFSRIFNTYIFRMPLAIPRLKNFSWSPEYQVDEDMKGWLIRDHVSIDEGLTKFLQENECEIFTVSGDGIRIFPDGVTSPDL